MRLLPEEKILGKPLKTLTLWRMKKLLHAALGSTSTHSLLGPDWIPLFEFVLFDLYLQVQKHSTFHLESYQKFPVFGLTSRAPLSGLGLSLALNSADFVISFAFNVTARSMYLFFEALERITSIF